MTLLIYIIRLDIPEIDPQGYPMLRVYRITMNAEAGWVNAMIYKDYLIAGVFVNTREAKCDEPFLTSKHLKCTSRHIDCRDFGQ